jgi:hypothetical protein
MPIVFEHEYLRDTRVTKFACRHNNLNSDAAGQHIFGF